MERTPSPDKILRPLLRRSATASPEVSSPTRTQDLDSRLSPVSRVSAIPSQAARKLHLHTRGLSKDEPRFARQPHSSRHGGHSHSPAHAVREIAKGATNKVTSSGRRLYEGGDGDNRSQLQARMMGDEDAVGGRAARPVTREDVAAERKRRALRTEELSTSLRMLTELANNMTRQLDDTYYAILEKAESLRKMVQQLQQLGQDSTALQEGFQRDVADVEKRVNRETEAFGDFWDQKNQVEQLEVRMKDGIERAKRLSERLMQARKRVGKWGQREREWQDKTSARLRASAITAATVIGVFVVLLILRLVWLKRQQESALFASFGSNTDAGGENDPLNLWDLRHTFRLAARKTAPIAKGQALGQDKRLRLLDEL